MRKRQERMDSFHSEIQGSGSVTFLSLQREPGSDSKQIAGFPRPHQRSPPPPSAGKCLCAWLLGGHFWFYFQISMGPGLLLLTVAEGQSRQGSAVTRAPPEGVPAGPRGAGFGWGFSLWSSYSSFLCYAWTPRHHRHTRGPRVQAAWEVPGSGPGWLCSLALRGRPRGELPGHPSGAIPGPLAVETRVQASPSGCVLGPRRDVAVKGKSRRADPQA